jgi:AcrR family transcriptional regulator
LWSVESGSTHLRRRRLSAADRRRRILDCADALFGTEGYRAVTVGRVCEAAGITTPVFYDHFASKRALYEELLVAHAERLVGATTVVPDDATLAETLHANVAAFFAFVEAHPGAWRMLFREAPDEPGIEALHAQIQAAATARLAETVVARADGLRFSVDVPAEQASLMLAELGKSALNGLAGWWWTNRDVDRATITAVAYELLWNGVAGIADEARPADPPLA